MKQATQREPAVRTPPHPYEEPVAALFSSAERERLIMEHLPQVRLIARRIHERLPESVNLDDLISAGTIGLISAIDRFDPSLNVKLKTYAEYKIRGSILDSLRVSTGRRGSSASGPSRSKPRFRPPSSACIELLARRRSPRSSDFAWRSTTSGSSRSVD